MCRVDGWPCFQRRSLLPECDPRGEAFLRRQGVLPLLFSNLLYDSDVDFVEDDAGKGGAFFVQRLYQPFELQVKYVVMHFLLGAACFSDESLEK